MSAIQRKSEEIAVLVSGEPRRFMLRAHPISKQLDQLERQEIGRNMGLELAEDSVGVETPLTGGARAYLASICPVICWLLSEPTDGGQALTEEDFWQLDSADPDRVIAAQEELTNMANILGNGATLLAIAGRRLLTRLQQDGSKSESPSHEPD